MDDYHSSSCSCCCSGSILILHIPFFHKHDAIEREKQKGNEFFRAGDLDEAVRCYCRSIDADSKNAIAYANRAMAYLKLEKLDKAEFDCTKSLQYDPTYIKAWSRRGLTRFKRGKYSDSAADFFMPSSWTRKTRSYLNCYRRPKTSIWKLKVKENGCLQGNDHKG